MKQSRLGLVSYKKLASTISRSRSRPKKLVSPISDIFPSNFKICYSVTGPGPDSDEWENLDEVLRVTNLKPRSPVEIEGQP